MGVVVFCTFDPNRSLGSRPRVTVLSVYTPHSAQAIAKETWPEEPIEVEASPDDLDVLIPDPLVKPQEYVDESAQDGSHTTDRGQGET